MDSDDQSLFEKAMQGVKPLKKSNKMFHRPTPNMHQTRPIELSSSALPNIEIPSLSDPWEIPDMTAESCLSFHTNRLPSKQFRRLKKGLFRPEARLDLHGFTPDKAKHALIHFMHQAKKKKLKTVLIIHGKGGRFHQPPLLKIHVNHWLQQIPEVLAFHSAVPSDGGYGAVYALLTT